MEQKNSKYSGRKLRKPDMKQEGNFTQIPNAFILNPNIKNSELRLLQYIMMYSDNRTITTKNCIKHLCKSKPTITSAFKNLIALGILKITEKHIEVVIPEEMKKYTLKYFDGKGNITKNSEKTIQEGKENITPEVKKTLPSEPEKTLQEDKENFTTEVKKTLPSGKENITPEVKKTYKKPLGDTDNEDDTNPIILQNSRVLPVSATSGNTEQSHSNSKTNGNTGIELDLECDSLQSLTSPSVLASSHHTPKVEDEKVGEKLSLPTGDDKSITYPIDEEVTQPTVEPEPLPIEPDKRFVEQLKNYNTSKYFLPEKFNRVKEVYNLYAEKYPNKYISIKLFEDLVVFIFSVIVNTMMNLKGVNTCITIYKDGLLSEFDNIPQHAKEMRTYKEGVAKMLKEFELKE